MRTARGDIGSWSKLFRLYDYSYFVNIIKRNNFQIVCLKSTELLEFIMMRDGDELFSLSPSFDIWKQPEEKKIEIIWNNIRFHVKTNKIIQILVCEQFLFLLVLVLGLGEQAREWMRESEVKKQLPSVLFIFILLTYKTKN